MIGKGTLVTKTKTHFINKDKIPYHEKYPNNYIKIKVIDDNGKKKELKLLKNLMNQMK